MKTQPLLRLAYVLFVLAVLLSPPGTQRAGAQDDDPVAEWRQLINTARSDAGLVPYGWSDRLASAAQRHADDLAATQSASHTGSDGSTAGQRVIESGYPAWTWSSGRPVAGENVWTGRAEVQVAFDWFMSDLPHRDNILSTRYREFGVGVAVDANGQRYHVIDFSVRPNGLPAFINDDRYSSSDPRVVIHLSNETVRPEGAGTSAIGRAVEVRLSNVPDFGDARWQLWEPIIPWTLVDQPGVQTVYVQYRDAAQRVAVAQDSIVLTEPDGTLPTLAPTSPPATPSLTPSATPVPPTETPEPTATPPEPTATPAQPSPSATAPGTPAAATPWPTPTPAAVVVVLTPFPTWTPLPVAATASPTPSGGSLLVRQWETRRTRMTPAGGVRILALLAAMQLAAAVLGIGLALRRRR